MTQSKKHWQECGQWIGEERKEVEGTCWRTLARACTCSEGLNLEILRKQSIKLNDQLNLRQQRSVKYAGFFSFCNCLLSAFNTSLIHKYLST